MCKKTQILALSWLQGAMLVRSLLMHRSLNAQTRSPLFHPFDYISVERFWKSSIVFSLNRKKPRQLLGTKELCCTFHCTPFPCFTLVVLQRVKDHIYSSRWILVTKFHPMRGKYLSAVIFKRLILFRLPHVDC